MTTLIYITSGEMCLFIKKTRKGDMNLHKWLGIGGHFEEGESPEECILRELYEETGIEERDIFNLRQRGIITFVSDEYGTEYMHVFTAEVPAGFTLPKDECNEGEFAWVNKDKVRELPIWEGDRIMFDYLFGREGAVAPCQGFFSMKFRYEGDRLVSHIEKQY